MSEALFELAWLLAGALGIIIVSFALSRALKGAQHGFSIRLQLFFAVGFASLCTATLIGTWALRRIEARAAQLFVERGLSGEVLQEFFKDFGTKTSLLFGLICVISAGCAWALGRLLAEPIERLARSAKQISHNEAREPLPEPTGREVRKLTEAFEEMLRALEDRQRFERFIADLSHDLKNPVAAIRASSEVLLSGAADDPEARVRFLGRIDEAGARLERLLSGLLSLARLEARGLKRDPEPWPLFEAMSAARRALAAVAEVKGVGVKLSFEGEEGLEGSEGSEGRVKIEGSRQWVTRALENLIANAVKHSPRGGLVRVTLRVNTTHAYIEVEDEGEGVEESLKGVLFERYITHASEEGTGLGLAIVRRVAEAHGGEARLLESEPGQGARFELSLKLKDQA